MASGTRPRRGPTAAAFGRRWNGGGKLAAEARDRRPRVLRSDGRRRGCRGPRRDRGRRRHRSPALRLSRRKADEQSGHRDEPCARSAHDSTLPGGRLPSTRSTMPRETRARTRRHGSKSGIDFDPKLGDRWRSVTQRPSTVTPPPIPESAPSPLRAGADHLRAVPRARAAHLPHVGVAGLPEPADRARHVLAQVPARSSSAAGRSSSRSRRATRGSRIRSSWAFMPIAFQKAIVWAIFYEIPASAARRGR